MNWALLVLLQPFLRDLKNADQLGLSDNVATGRFLDILGGSARLATTRISRPELPGGNDSGAARDLWEASGRRIGHVPCRSRPAQHRPRAWLRASRRHPDRDRTRPNASPYQPEHHDPRR